MNDDNDHNFAFRCFRASGRRRRGDEEAPGVLQVLLPLGGVQARPKRGVAALGLKKKYICLFRIICLKKSYILKIC